MTRYEPGRTPEDLASLIRRSRHGHPVRVVGHAGTGKTTLAAETAKLLHAGGKKTCLAAFTHQAVGVLRAKLEAAEAYGIECRTIHSLCRRPTDPAAAARERAEARWCALAPQDKADLLAAVPDDEIEPPGRERTFDDALPLLIEQDVQERAARIAELLQDERPDTWASLLAENDDDPDQALALIADDLRSADQKLGWTRSDARPPYELVLLDEASMISSELHDDLLAVLRLPAPDLLTGRTALFGDPAQLPPITGTPVLEEDHDPEQRVELHQVRRQEEGSDVLAIALAARTGEPTPTPRPFDVAEAARAGLVLCHYNATRKSVHHHVRTWQRRPTLPQPGELLVVHDVAAETRDELNLPKGTELLVLDALPCWGARPGRAAEPLLRITTRLGPGRPVHLWAWPAGFDVGAASDAGAPTPHREHGWADGEAVGADGESLGTIGTPPTWLDFGAARSVYKAQGSETDHVVVVRDFDRQPERKRRSLLYTAVARARTSVAFMRPPTPKPDDAPTVLGAVVAALTETPNQEDHAA